ncbi:uncharacterized protein BP5553_07213 [Venustampulla echinocandica]|uniref:Integral membrane protein n=1 Tax=Venustampulla echinocandica TaxID=2656787 RepID=A0A370TIW6_9HELO|nr:uncharacterized protein BP5553_07213 [Venustampulla echinocandica]RDL35282.1 hypothetical protein BP5553_07213 [Venustampulla echinocandica]
MPTMEGWNINALGMSYALTTISFVVIISRIVFRRLNHQKYLFDDYIVLHSMLLYTVITAVNSVVYYHGTNFSVNDPEHPKNVALDNLQHAVTGSRVVLVDMRCGLLYHPGPKAPALGLTAIQLFYFPRVLPVERVDIGVAGALLGITWVIGMLAIFMGCMPLRQYWQVLPNTPECARAIVSTIISGAVGTFYDIPGKFASDGVLDERTHKYAPIDNTSTGNCPRLAIKLSVALLAIFSVPTLIAIAYRMFTVIGIRPGWQANDLVLKQVECFAMIAEQKGRASSIGPRAEIERPIQLHQGPLPKAQQALPEARQQAQVKAAAYCRKEDEQIPIIYQIVQEYQATPEQLVVHYLLVLV